MAKKPKTKAVPSVHDRLATHASMTEQVKILIGRAELLRDQGKTAEAKRLLKRIEALMKDLKALES